MAKKFGALADFRRVQIEAPDPTVDKEPSQAVAPESESRKGRGRPRGKRSNPDYEPTTLLLRKLTKKKAARLLEDTDSNLDLSDLTESLLGAWISTHS